MGDITSWSAAVCAVAIICTLYNMIIPEGSTSKMLNFVLGMFLVVAILVPLTKVVETDSFSFNDIEYDSEYFSLPEKNDNITLSLAKSAIEKIIAESLEEKNINYKKISVEMDSSNNSSIDIIRTKIYVTSEYRNQLLDIQKIIKEKTGITPDVIVE